MLDISSSDGVGAVTFHPDGRHILGGSSIGIRRRQLEDSQVVRKHTGKDLHAISVSKDGKWMVCATAEGGTNVWDAEMQKKLIDVQHGKTVMTIDVSPDSTRFATGTGWGDNKASVWSLTSGEQLVGPLNHDSYVTVIRFSPNSECIATACWRSSIRVFDSRNGDELIIIKTITPPRWPSTLLAWSNDSQRIFAPSEDNRIKSFDVSMGLQLAESQTLHGGDVESIALAASGKFIATYTRGSVISFLETSSLSLIDPVIEDSKNNIYSVALSPDSGYLATGQNDGKIIIRDLGDILPDVYGPFHVSISPFTVLACQISLISSPIFTHYVRHLIAGKDNQASCLQHRVVVTTNHLVLPR